ncbi:unnamed protein product [Pleuronectes platessa]|uniref:Uncharacterized protein n=1 Tax=Pleuronectes platessa TaxID=8262 RepID=A0A9N7YIH2_PLEPL|nr:unnamed protein product [Pleuronectes platessa]
MLNKNPQQITDQSVRSDTDTLHVMAFSTAPPPSAASRAVLCIRGVTTFCLLEQQHLHETITSENRTELGHYTDVLQVQVESKDP